MTSMIAAQTRHHDAGLDQELMKQRQMESELGDMPNIGQEVARLLMAAGVRSPQQLRRLGAVAAAIKIKRFRPDDPPCRSMLAGLEGAIRAVRWHTILKAEREAIWKEYVARTIGRSVRR